MKVLFMLMPRVAAFWSIDSILLHMNTHIYVNGERIDGIFQLRRNLHFCYHLFLRIYFCIASLLTIHYALFSINSLNHKYNMFGIFASFMYIHSSTVNNIQSGVFMV